MQRRPMFTLPTGHTRVRHVPTGRIFARTITDAAEMCDLHPAEFQPVTDPNDRSIPEVLAEMPDLRAFARAHGVPAPLEADVLHIVRQLTPLIENGTIPMPTEEIV